MAHRHHLSEPSIIGQLEKNAYLKENAKTRGLLISPVQYQAGIASFGIYILYHLINQSVGQLEEIFSRAEVTLEELKNDKNVDHKELSKWFKAFRKYRVELAEKAESWGLERAYFHGGTFGKKLEKDGVPAIFSWESFDPWQSFDWIGFSMYYEPQILNMTNMLKRAGIPLYSKDRDDSYPIVLAGGVVAYSSEPVADMLDIIFVGDGEEQLPALYQIIEEGKAAGLKKVDILRRVASEIVGAYVPQFYKHTYDGLRTTKIESIDDAAPFPVRKAIVDFAKHNPLNPPIIPNCEGVLLGANSYEVARGCPYSCRFCMSSYTHKPYREFSYGQLALFMPELPKLWGLTSIKPYSFNLTSHNEMRKILKKMSQELDASVGSSSQRVDTFSHDMAKALRDTGSTGCTVAFEAGSQRLRNVINKEILREQIFGTSKSVIDLKYAQLKMYLMSNLPTETRDDRQELLDLLTDIRKYADSVDSKIVLRVTTTLFNAKPFTPFQWADCSNLSNILEEEGWLGKFADISVKVNSNMVSNSRILTQFLNRTDRRFGKFIEKLTDMNVTYISGDIVKNKDFMGMLTEWIKTLDKDAEISSITGGLPDDWIFPYEVIDTGITKEFLLKEWHKALQASITTSCHTGCTNCGVCTRKEFKNMAKMPKKLDIDITEKEVIEAMALNKPDPVFSKLMAEVELTGEGRFMPTSKLKILIRSAFELAGIPVKEKVDMLSEVGGLQNFSFGYDMFVLRSTRLVPSIGKEAIAKLNEVLGQYFTVKKVHVTNVDASSGVSSIDGVIYSMYYDAEKFGHAFPQEFLAENIKMTIREKKKTRRIGAFAFEERDIVVPAITEVKLSPTVSKIFFELDKSVNPNDILNVLFTDTKERRLLKAHAVKREVYFKYQTNPSVLFNNCSCGRIREHTAFGEPLETCIKCMMSS